MQNAPRRHMFAFIGVLAIFSAVFFSVNKAQKTASVQRELVTAEMGMEHSKQLDLKIEVSKLKSIGLIIISQEGEEEVFISLPDSWKRKEVKFASLSETQGEPSSFGFTRWRFPQGAEITFSMPVFPDALLMHNPSSIPVKTSVTMVDLDTEKVERDIVLVKDSPARFW